MNPMEKGERSIEDALAASINKELSDSSMINKWEWASASFSPSTPALSSASSGTWQSSRWLQAANIGNP
jgi:hypothetical protein